MNIIPIAFAFDNNLVEPACVCITSLLENANKDTYYDIFILHSNSVELIKLGFEKIIQKYNNCSITYLEVGDTFSDAFEIRGVTKATYYRLLLPLVINQYDKIIYSDVDIIYRMDLTEVYLQSLSDNYIAATLDLGLNYLTPDYVSSMNTLKVGQYIQAGFLIFNLKKIREDNLVTRFIDLANNNNFTYQDQDILNICCAGHIKYLSPKFNVNDCAFLALRSSNRALLDRFSKGECEEAMTNGNIHYSGKKPWKEYSICMDLWWEYYRKSVVFNIDKYFDFFFNRSFYLDSLSLWERIKLLLRFFVYGKTKIQ